MKSSKPINVTGELLAQLPKAAHIWFRLHPQTANTLAFERAGFTCTTQWSVEIAPRPKDDLWKQMRDKTRNAIRRAGDILTVETLRDGLFFPDFYKQSLREAGRANNYDDDLLRMLIPEAIRRQQGRVLAAMAADGTPQAAIFTVWNEDREFYFMSSRSPKAHFGAVNLLIWHAIQTAAVAGRVFDMDNIHVVNGNLPNLLLLSGFGGEIVPRYCVSKTSPMLALGKTLGQALRR